MTQARRSLALIHTVPALHPTFEGLLATIMPGWRPVALADESLLREAIRDGAVSATVARRLLALIWQAVDGGAEAVVVTCSSMGGAVEAARPFCPVPLFRIDEGMARQAVALGRRIGVLATLPTTLAPTAALIRAVGPEAEVTPVLCDGAFALLQAGETAAHDAQVAAALTDLAGRVDVVVLAQASMARVLTTLPPMPCPVLTSPEPGVQYLRDRLGA